MSEKLCHYMSLFIHGPVNICQRAVAHKTTSSACRYQSPAVPDPSEAQHSIGFIMVHQIIQGPSLIRVQVAAVLSENMHPSTFCQFAGSFVEARYSKGRPSCEIRTYLRSASPLSYCCRQLGSRNRLGSAAWNQQTYFPSRRPRSSERFTSRPRMRRDSPVAGGPCTAGIWRWAVYLCVYIVYMRVWLTVLSGTEAVRSGGG